MRKNKRNFSELFWVTELFHRYYEDQATEKEKRVIEKWDPEEKYSNEIKYMSPDHETELLWKKIARELNLEMHRKQKQRISVYQYAAAASLIFFIFLGYQVMHTYKSVFSTGTSIEIGTDKAILTLEDGSEVFLKQGIDYQNINAQSNGTEIVYKPISLSSSEHTISKMAYNYLTIPRGGQFFVQLTDGTKVWLNSESKLKYPVSFVDGETRQVELVYGEAYFDVSSSTLHKGAKFKVVNSKQNIEVLGTEFNIKAYKDETDIYTTLIEGKVEVNTGNTQKILLPNEQSVLNLNDDSLIVKPTNVHDVVSWKKGVFSFKATSLKNIMKVLSRWYDVEVQFENSEIEEVKFNGVLKKNQSLEDILTTLQTTKSINGYEIKNKKIIIK